MKQARAFFLVLLLILTGCSAPPQPEGTVPALPETAAATTAPATTAPETAAPETAAPETAATVAVSPGDPGVPAVNENGVTTYRPGDPGWYPPWPEGVASPPDPAEEEEIDAGQPEPDVTVPEEPYEPAWEGFPEATRSTPALFTDISQYELRARAQSKYTRLSEAPMTEFTPMPGLGAVYPYAASRISNKYYFGDSNAFDYSWGFVDENGRVLTDGIYIEIYPLSGTNTDLDYNTHIYLPFWIVKGAVNWDEKYSIPCWGIVSMDGSFALPPIYDSITELDGGFVARRGRESFEVYDNEGKLCFTDKELGDFEFYGGSVVEGRFLLGKESDEWTISEYWFADETGTPVLGPYKDAQVFRNGIACVRPFGQDYGFIDRNGSWVIEPCFKRPGNFRNGRLVLQEKNGIRVYDGTGAEVFRVGTEVYGLNQRSFGFEEIYWDQPFAPRNLYDFNGNVLMQAEQGEEFMLLDANTILRKQPGSMALELRSLRSPDRGVRIENALDAVAAVTQKDGKPLRGYVIEGYGAYDDQERDFFLTEDMSELWELPEGAFCRYALRDSSVAQPRDWMTNEEYSVYRAGRNNVYYAQDGRRIGQSPTDADTELIGGRLRVLTKDACTYYDKTGTAVFSYPLFDMLDD